MLTIPTKIEIKLIKEPMFQLFTHNGLLCCIQRMSWSGQLNGYVSISEKHPLFGKRYSDKINLSKEPEFNGNYIGLLCSALDPNREEDEFSIDMALDVHGGITYSSGSLNGLKADIFKNLWWFGFDTLHAGDLKPFQSEIDLEYPISSDEYRDFEYVKSETIKLADQLSALTK